MPSGVYQHKPLTAEHKQSISQKLKGTKQSPEHVQHTKDAKGIMSDKTKIKMSIAKMGVEFTEPHKNKISKSNVGIHNTREHNQAILDGMCHVKELKTKLNKKEGI